MQLLSKHYTSNLLLFFITGLFLMEFFTTIYIHYSNLNTTRIVGVYKLIFELFIILLIPFRSASKKIVLSVLFLSITYLINQLLNPLFLENLNYHLTKGSLYYLNRFIFIFIFILAFSSLKDGIETAKTIVKVIEYILFFNAILLIFGAVFSIPVLTSYPQSPARFGSDGLFSMVNAVSYLYSIYIFTLYYKYIKGTGKLWKLLFIIASCFFIGTKTILLFIGLLTLFHFLFVSLHKKKFRFVFIPGILLVTVFSNKILTYLFNLSPFWRQLGEDYSLLTLVFSTRDLSVIANYNYVMEHWTTLNYLIGGPFYTISFKRTLMDSIDLLLHFGILSSTVYIYLIVRYFFKKNTIILNCLVAFVIFCGFLAGGLFLRILPVIYLYLAVTVLHSLHHKEEEKLVKQ